MTAVTSVGCSPTSQPTDPAPVEAASPPPTPPPTTAPRPVSDPTTIPAPTTNPEPDVQSGSAPANLDPITTAAGEAAACAASRPWNDGPADAATRCGRWLTKDLATELATARPAPAAQQIAEHTHRTTTATVRATVAEDAAADHVGCAVVLELTTTGLDLVTPQVATLFVRVLMVPADDGWRAADLQFAGTAAP